MTGKDTSAAADRFENACGAGLLVVDQFGRKRKVLCAHVHHHKSAHSWDFLVAAPLYTIGPIGPEYPPVQLGGGEPIAR